MTKYRIVKVIEKKKSNYGSYTWLQTVYYVEVKEWFKWKREKHVWVTSDQSDDKCLKLAKEWIEEHKKINRPVVIHEDPASLVMSNDDLLYGSQRE